MSTTEFRPSVHGWAFGNTFRYSPSVLGLSTPVAPGFGLCGGMCWTALDRYFAQRLPQALETPSPGEPLYEEVLQRQVNALAHGVWADIHAWHEKPDARRWLWQRHDAGSGSLAGYGAVRRSLAAGRPVLLCLIRVEGPFANPTANHMVLAWSHDHDRKAKRGRIRVYDPNHPTRDDVVVELALSRDEGRIAMSQSTGEPVRGLFVIDYDRPMPMRFRGERYDERQPLGFNQPLAGRPAVVSGRRGLDVFCRDANADVIHFRRDREGWRAANLTVPATIGVEYKLATDPVVAAGGGRELFGRTSQGDLVRYYRRGRGWRAEGLTRRKNVGPDYRLEGTPTAVTGPGRRRWVFGRNGDGHLVVYRSKLLRGWTATNLTRDRDFKSRYRLATDPVATVGPGEAVHVYGLDERGGLLHYYWTPKGGWASENLAERQRTADLYRAAGRPVPLQGPGLTHSVFLRDAQGGIVRYGWAPGRSWAAELVTERAGPAAAEPDDPARYRIAGDPGVVLGPEGSIHVLGRNDEGELVHYFKAPGGPWTVEDLTAERPAIEPGLRLSGDPATGFAPGPTQHVFGRQDRDLLLYRWQAASSWTAENLTLEREHLGTGVRIAGKPILAAGPDGAPHVVAVDGDGRLVHIYAVR